MLTVEASLFHWKSIIFSETFSGNNAEAEEDGQLFSTFKHFFNAYTLQS
jgi:hypothetical protein